MGIRAKVWKQRIESPLFCVKTYASDLEKVFKAMWDRYQNGEKPDHISHLSKRPAVCWNNHNNLVEQNQKRKFIQPTLDPRKKTNKQTILYISQGIYACLKIIQKRDLIFYLRFTEIYLVKYCEKENIASRFQGWVIFLLKLVTTTTMIELIRKKNEVWGI